MWLNENKYILKTFVFLCTTHFFFKFSNVEVYRLSAQHIFERSNTFVYVKRRNGSVFKKKYVAGVEILFYISHYYKQRIFNYLITFIYLYNNLKFFLNYFFEVFDTLEIIFIELIDLFTDVLFSYKVLRDKKLNCDLNC